MKEHHQATKIYLDSFLISYSEQSRELSEQFDARYEN